MGNEKWLKNSQKQETVTIIFNKSVLIVNVLMETFGEKATFCKKLRLFLEYLIFIFVERYTKGNKTVYVLNYHIVWSPKYRRSVLVGDIKKRLETIIEEAVCEKRGKVLAMEVMPDHVHLCVSLSPDVAPYKMVKLAKGRSSNVLRKEFPELLKMPTLWTRSYFIATSGTVSTDTILNYVKSQWDK